MSPDDAPSSAQLGTIGRFYGAMLRLFWRTIAWRHPRGLIDVLSFRDEGGRLLVFTEGMDRFELPDIEIAEVPHDLGGYAHGIMFDIIGYMNAIRKEGKYIRAGEDFGGLLVADDQNAYHLATARDSHRRSRNGNSVLRFVDLHEPFDSGFPRKLFAAHLCALAGKSRDPAKQEALCRRAIAIHNPSDPYGNTDGADDGEFDPRKNYNNFGSWLMLGDSLVYGDRAEEAIPAFKEAIARCPRWAREYAAFIRDSMKSRPRDRSSRVAWDFWTTVHVEDVCAEMRRK